MRLRAILCSLALASAAYAMQVQDLDLVSPVTGVRFSTVAVTAQGGTEAGPADMGFDVDTCRHSSGVSEYDYFLIVDPHSYFTCLSTDYEPRTGKLRFSLSTEMMDWLRREYAGERETDRTNAFDRAMKLARASGQTPPDHATFVIPQGVIPIAKQYRLALACYTRLGARNAALAKIALSGAWALRCRAQLPVSDQSLVGGFEEVNQRNAGKIKEGEPFDQVKWLKIYSDLVEKDGLTREGYVVAAMALFGFQLRDGDLESAKGTITKTMQRLGDDDKPELLRGLVRDRKHLLDDYTNLLGTAAQRFLLALSNEEVVRARIPEVMLVVGECFRRTGDLERAANWYLALGRLPETQPSVRAELRAQGKANALPADQSGQIQLGWIADEQFARLRAGGITNPGEVGGGDRTLLFAIINEGLGTSAYPSPGWKPAAGGNQTDSTGVLTEVGLALLDYTARLGSWPKNLGELWERELIRDRNHVNRFNDPATGKPLQFSEPPGSLERIPADTVLIATSAPVPTPQGPKYGAFLANARIVWVDKQPTSGQRLPTGP